MSTAEVVEQPSLATQSSHQHLVFDDIEVTGFRLGPASHSRRGSHMPVINVDDDASEAVGSMRPRSHRASRPSFSNSRDNRPPTTRRRFAEDVIVVENTGSRETWTQRRANNGAENSPIVVLDSDEEQESASSSHRRRRRRVSASSFRIFSPPPPPQQHHHVPPVPTIPPIVAEPLPFAILPPPENNNQGRGRLPFDETPRSVNNGNDGATRGNGIHLGGGLFSHGNRSGNRHSSRTHVHFRSPPRDHIDLVDEPRNNQGWTRTTGRTASWFGRIFASYVSGGAYLSSQSGQSTSNAYHSRSGMTLGRFLPLPFHSPELVGGQHPSSGNFFRISQDNLGPWARRDAAIGLGPDYEKSMTHPDRAGPGWTHDIGLEPAEESSKVDESEILVCAVCLDPLLANSDGMDVTEEERKGRRVWGLRCGHVMDGKCVDSLMRPDQGNDSADDEDVYSQCIGITKGKGKAKAKRRKVVPEHASGNEVKELVAIPNDKGKGKVPPVPNGVPTPPSLVDEAMAPIASPSIGLVGGLSTEEPSIRSRLRPRRSTGVPPSSPAVLSCSYRPANRQPTLTRPSANGDSSSTRRRGTKRKRGARGAAAKDEVVEERYEWTCPISGCGRVHVSIKMGGQWRMDPELGAVAIYV